MIGLEDRRTVAQNILVAHTAGARLRLACETAGIELRTLQRWKAHDGLIEGDGRPHAVRPMPSHALSPAERVQLLAVRAIESLGSAAARGAYSVRHAPGQSVSEGNDGGRFGV